MPTKDNLVSARKKLIMSSVKTSLKKLAPLDFDEADKELTKLHRSLTKTFGDKGAADLIEQAIEQNDKEFAANYQAILSGVSLEKLQELGENA